MKLKKSRKSKKMRGKGMGTHGWGARKKHQGSGHRGGVGMAGTGKRADHKKSLVIKLYGDNYFGKSGVTSKSTKRKKNLVMNLDYIEQNMDSLKKRFGNKEGVLDLKKYKILGRGEVKNKIKVRVKSISESAKKAILAVGGEVMFPKIVEKEKKDSKKKGKKEEKEAENESKDNTA